MSERSERSDDVIVVGGGPAGALAATILARAGARVRILERARFPRHKLCGDTLNPGALAVLARHLPIDTILRRGLALDGMVLTGPGGVAVRGRYGAGLTGRSIARSALDLLLVDEAVAAGAHFDDEAMVTSASPSPNGVGRVTVRGRGQAERALRARLIIGADGRESRLARALKLSRYSTRPRRWAVGAYFDGVDGLTPAGEMHVRAGHYIGVAPMPDGLANVCLVVPRGAAGGLRDPAAALHAALTSDPSLAARASRARRVSDVHVLGPMAVDATGAGVPGLLLAGDAAGFIDPMTGDGLRLALSGAAMAAELALDVLAGRVRADEAPRRLASRRRAAFAAKWRFNKTLRALVGFAPGVSVSAVAARVLPAVFEAMIRYAGDCDLDDGLPQTPGLKPGPARCPLP